MVRERYVYRGETFWNRWENFFEAPFAARWFRDYDLGVAPELSFLRLPQGHSYCGYWVWGAQSDAARFCLKEPWAPEQERWNNSFNVLRRQDAGAHLLCQRILIRIDIDFLNGLEVMPDRLLASKYANGYESAKVYYSSCLDYRDDGWRAHTSNVTLPDHSIELYYNGWWLPKSVDLGVWLKRQLASVEAIHGFSRGLGELCV